jgi:internalin A
MHYTEALRIIEKNTDIKNLRRIKFDDVLHHTDKNCYNIDLKGNIIALNLKENNIIRVPFLSEFYTLKQLYLNDNNIIDIFGLAMLHNLEDLDLFGNYIVDISPLSKLINLKKIDLSFNKINRLYPLKKLNNLQRLRLTHNNVSDVSSLVKLEKVQKLELGMNKISDILPLEKLYDLEDLDLSRNQISDISPLEKFTKLKTLNLSNNIILDISFLAKLLNLQELRLYNTQISDVSPLISLTNLITLSLSNNQITNIFPLLKLEKLKYLYVENNPIKGIPIEYTTDTPKKIMGIEMGDKRSAIEKIRAYYAAIEKEAQYIFEGKLVLVGEPAAGKTSLSEKIRNANYKLKTGNHEEQMTKGIAVAQWSFPYTNPKNTETHEGFDGKFTAHIFDFGGQDIMHATHRYFLSKKTLYVLVVDTRPEDTDFFYWLNVIELYGANSPVIIVLNDKHNVHKDIPKHITEQFSHLIENRIYRVNLGNNEGLADVVKRIQTELQNLAHVGTEKHPKTWVDIRQALYKQWSSNKLAETIQFWKNKTDKKPCLTRQEYIALCETCGIIEEEKSLEIADTLHTLGTILYFQDNTDLVDTLILDKHWATEAVYLVLLDKEVAKNYGKFNDNTDLRRIWKDKYPVEKHHALVQLMVNFKIAYQVKDSNTYIAPQLLAENPPDSYAQVFEPNTIFTHFEYRYPKFMPKGLLSRLIVECNKAIYKNFQWRYGVILEIQGCLVEITEHFYGSTQKMAIRTQGSEALRAMSVVFHTMHTIHSDFPNLKTEEMIPCNCEKCKVSNMPHFYEHSVLQDFMKENEPNIQCLKSKKMVAVRALLEGHERHNQYKNREMGEISNHIEGLEMYEFFDKFGDKIKQEDKVIFENLRREYTFDKCGFDFYDRAKVLLGKYEKK